MEIFKGPVLIIGVPRSGTKLLRDLLNQNPIINIPIEETHFIPYLYDKFNGVRPTHPERLEKFYEELSKTTFFSGMQKRGIYLDKSQFISKVDASSWSKIFEFILRFYGPKEGTDTFFGDKTPSYLEKTLFLKREVFPQAKFIHIIRDPLDCCISAKKIWGKNMFQFAEMWNDAVIRVRKDSSSFVKDYLEVTYESLVTEPKVVMLRICEFIGCTYSDKMLSLEVAAENYGDTKDANFIVEKNSKKYLEKLTPEVIQRIEEIAYEGMMVAGYKPNFASSSKPLNSLERVLFKTANAYNSLRFHIREKGIWHGIMYCLRLHSLIKANLSKA